MGAENKPYDAVASMRKARDELSRRFKGMSFAEQKRAMAKLAKGKPRRVAAAKRRTA